jgi:hypothetical protein
MKTDSRSFELGFSRVSPVHTCWFDIYEDMKSSMEWTIKPMCNLIFLSIKCLRVDGNSSKKKKRPDAWDGMHKAYRVVFRTQVYLKKKMFAVLLPLFPKN